MTSGKRTVVVAGGGLAREVIAVLNREGPNQVVAILDDDPELHGHCVDGIPVIGGLAEIATMPDVHLVICAGSGKTRKALTSRLDEIGVADDRYRSVVHPSVTIPPGCSVGTGTILLAGAVMTADVTVGAHVVAMPHAVFTHDVIVGDYATVCAGVALGGGVTVGQRAYLGMNSSVRPHVSIGDDAVLGMGAVLLTDLPAGEIWYGVPAARAHPSTQTTREQS